jgi:lysophospholipase L1-like esterase
MGIINGLDLTSQPTVLLVSLFTNDGPTATDQLAAAVRQTLADVGEDGCAVWATIVRPPYNGVSYANANKTLHLLEAQYAPKLILVPWAETVAQEPGLIAGDGVHGTTEGYQVRAQLYAQAVQQCLP